MFGGKLHFMSNVEDVFVWIELFLDELSYIVVYVLVKWLKFMLSLPETWASETDVVIDD
jgi:hypothetical protein